MSRLLPPRVGHPVASSAGLRPIVRHLYGLLAAVRRPAHQAAFQGFGQCGGTQVIERLLHRGDSSSGRDHTTRAETGGSPRNVCLARKVHLVVGGG